MLIAGMDTTTNTLAHILNLLSQHQDVQDRLRTEILQAIEADGDGAALDFDRLMTSRTSKPCAESPSDCTDRKSTRLNSSHSGESRMPSSA